MATHQCPQCGGRSALKGVRRCSTCSPNARISVDVFNQQMVEFHLMATLDQKSIAIAREIGLLKPLAYYRGPA